MGYIPRRLRGPRKRPPQPITEKRQEQQYLMLPTYPPKYKAIPLEPPMTETVKRPASGSWRSLWR